MLDLAEWPLEVLSTPIAYVEGVVGNVRDYFNVLEQNQALREENAELRQWMNDALAMRETLAAYERLQTFYAPPQAKPINAFVIGESNDAFSHSMLVNVGASDEVQRGQAVIDDLGLVGRIVDVGKSASRILLLTDIQSRVPVYVEEANLEGLLVGRTKARPAISFTESSEPVVFEPGQRVLTSGAGGVLPRGLPVGVVVADNGGEAIIDLFANFARTRMVRVINYDFPSLDPLEEGAALAEPGADEDGQGPEGPADSTAVDETAPADGAPQEPLEG